MLSLERGSLLDIILRTKGVRTSLWEKTIERLRGLEEGGAVAAYIEEGVAAAVEVQ